MCRLSSEVFVAAGGSGVLASVATFAKAHWDAIKDRKAFRAAKEREDQRRIGQHRIGGTRRRW